MATTGKGRGPLYSAWGFRKPNCAGTDTLRKWVGGMRNDAGRTVFLDWWLGVASGATYYGVLKRWTGAAWVKTTLKRWTGAAWVAATLKRWTGAAWVQVDTTGV